MLKFSISAIVLALSLSPMVIHQDKTLRPELISLIESERAFSKLSVEKGVRHSFTEFFADEGLNFTPEPVNIKESFRKRPAPARPQPFTLSWEPVFADVSEAGDLGYTTGPFISVDNDRKNPSQHGYYFSVWKKQSDGSWKVLLDAGISTPSPSDSNQALPLKIARATGWKSVKRLNQSAELTRLMNLDKQMSEMSKRQGVVKAYRHYLFSESRLHRNNLMPILNKESILSFLSKKQMKRISFEPMNAVVAESADLGYTYGKFELEESFPAGSTEQGYFARVWKRDSRGNWKIVTEIVLPLASDQKPGG
jgi:ketosteroid isomerase-like protein